MPSKRALALGGAAFALVGLGYRVRRATLHDATVMCVSSETPVVARITLDYGPGVRPWSVIVDLLSQNGASGSVTCDGDTTAVDLPLATPFSGAYTLTTTATYRFLGIPKTITQTYIGNLQ